LNKLKLDAVLCITNIMILKYATANSSFTKNKEIDVAESKLLSVERKQRSSASSWYEKESVVQSFVVANNCIQSPQCFKYFCC